MKPLYLIMMMYIAGISATSYAYAIHLTPTRYDALSLWNEDDLEHFFETFEISCNKLKWKKKSAYMHFSHIGGKVRDWLPVCQKISTIKHKNSTEKRYFIEREFTPHFVSDQGQKVGKFTGYFEASLEGSDRQSAIYPYPVYRMPSGFNSGGDFYSRKEIDAGVLNGKNLELLWVKDDVTLFFAHVQGSATVQMEDGSVKRIGFAGKTAHPYRAIGKYLIEQGHIAKADVNADSIKAWLYMHPEQRKEVYAYNPSYIFFREVKGQDGPIGGQNVPLTAERSLAIDKGLIAYGMPIWLETTLTLDNTPYHRLMVAQDTGSAIKGAVRGDIFFGFGKAAEQKASYQHSEGRYFIFLPKGVK